MCQGYGHAVKCEEKLGESLGLTVQTISKVKDFLKSTSLAFCLVT